MRIKVNDFFTNRKVLISFFLIVVSMYIIFICLAYVDIYEKNLQVAENYLEFENYKLISNLDAELSKLSNKVLFLQDSRNKLTNIDKDLKEVLLDNNNRIPNEFTVQDIYITNKNFLVKAGTSKGIVNLKSNFENPTDNKYIWFSEPIKKHNIIEGYVFFNIERKIFDDFVKNLGFSKNVRQCISDSSGNIIYISEYVNAKNTKELFENENIENNKFYKNKNKYNKDLHIYKTQNNNFGLDVYTTVEDNFAYGFGKIPERMVIITLLCFLLTLLFLIMFLPSTKDFNKLVAFAEQISIGNTNMRNLKIKSRKLKKMEIALNRTLRNVNYLSNGILKLNRCVEEGDLRNTLSELNTSGSYYNALYNAGKTMDKLINYLDYIDMPVLILNRDFNIMYANKATSEISFLGNEKIENQNFFTSFNLADIVNSNSILEKAYNTKKPQSSITDLYLETKIIKVKYFAKPILDKKNNFVSMVVCFFNISDTGNQVSETFDYRYVDERKIINIKKFENTDYVKEKLV